MKLHNQIKRSNSKGDLARAIINYQNILKHYSDESNWAVKGDDIVWVGDDDPTYAAQLALGLRKIDPSYNQRNRPNSGQKATENHVESERQSRSG